MNGAVAKISWPRAAPRSRAPLTHNTIDAPYPAAPTANAAITSPAPNAPRSAPTAKPRTKLAEPATKPFNKTTCSGLSWSIMAVTPLSNPQARQAPAMKSAPVLTSAPGCQPSTAPAAVTSSAPMITRRPRCSRKIVAARATVAASSRFNKIDALAAEVLARPATNNAGPIAPPATTATIAGFQS